MRSSRKEREVRVLAPAKVNLILKVLDRRPDGYHNIWSLMHTVGLEDELRFRLTRRSTGVRWVVLVHPGFPIETRWAYERLASTRQAVPPLSPTLRGVAGRTSFSWDDVVPLMENDFEEALAQTHGVLREIKKELLSAGAEAALLSGSGATVFGVFRDKASAGRARASVGRASGRRAYAVHTGAASFQREAHS